MSLIKWTSSDSLPLVKQLMRLSTRASFGTKWSGALETGPKYGNQTSSVQKSQPVMNDRVKNRMSLVKNIDDFDLNKNLSHFVRAMHPFKFTRASKSII